MAGNPIPLPVAAAILLSDLAPRIKKSRSGQVLISSWQVKSLTDALEAAAPGLLAEVEENDRKRRKYEKARAKGSR